MFQIDFNEPIHVFFSGIGGISMSGLAEILRSRGFTVSGSDRTASPITEELTSHGIPVVIGQKRENITPDIDLVVFTAAIHPDNPEYMAVQELGIPHLTRAQLLGQLMKGYQYPVAVSGTHGKTTTTSMLSEILIHADTDPTLSIGGILRSIGGQVRVGGHRYFVAEACEYTNSFLSMYPRLGIILNIDADHLDFFKDLEDIRRSFRRFAELIPADGCLIISADIPDYSEITEGLPCRIITYGSDSSSDWYADGISYDSFGHASYTLHGTTPDGTPVEKQVSLKVPGRHNVSNSVAALAAASVLGVDMDTAIEAVSAFAGTDRRFEYKGTMNGVTIIDDYAHHPTEIKAALAAASNYPHNRVWCIFQPHTFTRTKALMQDFAEALTHTDITVLAKIYPARETDDLGISSATLQKEIRALGHDCLYFENFEEIEEYVRQNCREGDLVITMGAGDVFKIGENLLS